MRAEVAAEQQQLVPVVGEAAQQAPADEAGTTEADDALRDQGVAGPGSLQVKGRRASGLAATRPSSRSLTGAATPFRRQS